MHCFKVDIYFTILDIVKLRVSYWQNKGSIQYPFLNFVAVQSSPRPGQFLFHSRENWILPWQIQIYNCVSTIGRRREYTKMRGWGWGGNPSDLITPNFSAGAEGAKRSPGPNPCQPPLPPSFSCCRLQSIWTTSFFKSTQFNKIFN